MLAFADVVHFFTDELSRLRGGGLSHAFVPASPSQRVFFRHTLHPATRVPGFRVTRYVCCRYSRSRSGGTMATSDDARELTAGIPAQDLRDGAIVAGRVGDENALLVVRGNAYFAIGAKCTHY